MFPVAAALVAMSLLYLAFVVVRSGRPMPVPTEGATDLQYVVVVPCLDEEIVIGNTLHALCALPADRLRIIVVDDDSSDRTSEIAASFAPRVELIQRRKPDAQLGKGDSLNVAYAHVLATNDRPSDKVIFGVLDADGRFDPNVIDVADRFFSECDVGGLQLGVSIMNRRANILTRLQDFEFLGFAPILLTAREHLGSVVLGGNGQFARLSALECLGPIPWTDSLTEDLDLGIRLLLGGSRVRFTTEARVNQQGLTDVRRLVRQRTRWVQGHLQAWSLIPPLWRSRVPNKTFLDLLYVLLAPGLMLLSSIVFAAAPILLAWSLTTGAISLNNPQLPFFLLAVYLLMFGPALFYGFAYARHVDEVRLPLALCVAHLMPVYTYMWYVASWRALSRIVLRRRNWAKTARLEDVPAEPLPNQAVAAAAAAESAFDSHPQAGRHRDRGLAS